MRRADPWMLDAILATAFVVLALIGHLARTGGAGVRFRDTDALSVLMTLAVALPYFVRRRAPLAVLLISELGVLVLTVREYRTGATPFILLIGVYTVAAWCPARQRLIGLAALAAGLAIVAVTGIPGASGADIAFNMVQYLAAYLFGAMVRTRRLYSDEIEARAAALERDREQDAMRAVAEERLRIAQELHDVVAHSMGVIAVQAGVGAHVIDSDPVEAKRSLQAIAETSRSSLTEIRRLLSVLRDDNGALYTPAPGLADLSALVRDISSAGLRVDVRCQGAATSIPPGVDFTAYRIVQEALTNALKHAGPAQASVIVTYEPGALSLEIVDDGRGVNGRSTDGGHGLLGMRERVAVYGGTFDAGPRHGGGFRVGVRLPYGEPV